MVKELRTETIFKERSIRVGSFKLNRLESATHGEHEIC